MTRPVSIIFPDDAQRRSRPLLRGYLVLLFFIVAVVFGAPYLASALGLHPPFGSWDGTFLFFEGWLVGSVTQRVDRRMRRR